MADEDAAAIAVKSSRHAKTAEQALQQVEKQLGKIQQRLNGVRAAAKALGDSTSRELKGAKKRVLSAVARARIGRAAKKRWAKFRAQAKKVAG
jgi:hypothetical protein